MADDSKDPSAWTDDQVADYFKQNFNTPLTDTERNKYQSWLDYQTGWNGSDPTHASDDYDMQGFWKKYGDTTISGHFTDEFKKPNHPTFSEESQYSGAPSAWGGTYQGGTWADDGSSYTPSAEMLRTTHSLDKLKAYMSQYEPDVKLNLDRVK